MMRYPVAIFTALSAVLSSGIALAAIFWPDTLTPEATAAIILFGNAILGTIAAILGTSMVTPTADARLNSGTNVTVLNTDGTVSRTTTL